MTGNGVAPGTEDAGNLIVISGSLLSAAAPPILLAQFGSGNVISEVLVSNPTATLEKFASLRFYDGEGDPMPVDVLVSGAVETSLAGEGMLVDGVDFSIAPLAARGRSTFSELRRYAPVAAAMATLTPTFGAERPQSV